MLANNELQEKGEGLDYTFHPDLVFHSCFQHIVVASHGGPCVFNDKEYINDFCMLGICNLVGETYINQSPQ